MWCVPSTSKLTYALCCGFVDRYFHQKPPDQIKVTVSDEKLPSTTAVSIWIKKLPTADDGYTEVAWEKTRKKLRNKEMWKLGDTYEYAGNIVKRYFLNKGRNEKRIWVDVAPINK